MELSPALHRWKLLSLFIYYQCNTKGSNKNIKWKSILQGWPKSRSNPFQSSIILRNITILLLKSQPDVAAEPQWDSTWAAARSAEHLGTCACTAPEINTTQLWDVRGEEWKKRHKEWKTAWPLRASPQPHSGSGQEVWERPVILTAISAVAVLSSALFL